MKFPSLAAPEELYACVFPPTLPENAVDPGDGFGPRGRAGSLPSRPLQPLRPLQAPKRRRNGGGRSQPLQRHLVRLGSTTQQRNRRRYKHHSDSSQ